MERMFRAVNASDVFAEVKGIGIRFAEIAIRISEIAVSEMLDASQGAFGWSRTETSLSIHSEKANGFLMKDAGSFEKSLMAWGFGRELTKIPAIRIPLGHFNIDPNAPTDVERANMFNKVAVEVLETSEEENRIVIAALAVNVNGKTVWRWTMGEKPKMLPVPDKTTAAQNTAPSQNVQKATQSGSGCKGSGNNGTTAEMPQGAAQTVQNASASSGWSKRAGQQQTKQQPQHVSKNGTVWKGV